VRSRLLHPARWASALADAHRGEPPAAADPEGVRFAAARLSRLQGVRSAHADPTPPPGGEAQAEGVRFAAARLSRLQGVRSAHADPTPPPGGEAQGKGGASVLGSSGGSRARPGPLFVLASLGAALVTAAVVVSAAVDLGHTHWGAALVAVPLAIAVLVIARFAYPWLVTPAAAAVAAAPGATTWSGSNACQGSRNTKGALRRLREPPRIGPASNS